MGEREGREGLGGGGEDRLPPTRPGSVQEKGLTRGEGDTVFRRLSGATLPTKSIYMHLPRWGQVHRGARWAPGGCWDHQPSGGDSQGPVSASLKSVQFVGFYLQAGGLGGKSKVV